MSQAGLATTVDAEDILAGPGIVSSVWKKYGIWNYLLRLLCNEQGQFKIIQPQGRVVELVDVGKEANVLRGFVG